MSRIIAAFFLLSAAIFLAGCSYSLNEEEWPHPGTKPPKEDPDTTWTPNPPTDTIHTDTGWVAYPESPLAHSARFGEEVVFKAEELQVLRGEYTKAKTYDGKLIPLEFTFLAPANDTLEKRPFILLLHEGAFLFGDLSSEYGKAQQLAQRGYAVACINYRLGFKGAREGYACNSNTPEVIRAVYRSVQDMYAALRFFLSDSRMRIDPSQVFIGGSSAGAIAASALAYMKESEFERLHPGITKLLGALDPQHTGDAVSIKALLTYLGYGLFDTGYIRWSTAKPTVFFQRAKDNVLAFTAGPLFYCSNYLYTYGARTVADHFTPLKVPFELNYEPEEGHHLSYDNAYIASRYALFIKRLWKRDFRQITNEKYRTVSNVALTY